MKVQNIILAAACALLSTTATAQNFSIWHNGDFVASYDLAEGDSIVFSNNPSIGGHEYVDLGLSVKWATCNVGSPVTYGDGEFYAWGETKTREPETYNYANYPYYKDGQKNKVTKYGKNPKYWGVEGENPDSLTVLLPEDDAATANWGNGWRMPTKVEFQELLDNCTWEWVELDPEKDQPDGFKITGPNGNSIFLPAAGYYNNEPTTALYGTERLYTSYCFYWSSTSVEYTGYYLNASKVQCKMFTNVRSYAMAIRPVHD